MVLSYSQMPSLWPAYWKAVSARKPPLLPSGRSVPPLYASLKGYRPDSRRLEAYRELCGFARSGRLPVTYPQVLAFPLQLRMLVSEQFPVRVLGLVHLRNLIESMHPVMDGQPVDLLCALQGHRDTERGQEFEMITKVEAEGACVWTQSSVFLARRPGRAGAPAPRTPEASPPLVFDAAANVGRRYAWISGDWNPIHLSGPTARLFGYRRPIAHGMWSLARCLAELGVVEGGVEVDFKRPLKLPSRVGIARNGAHFRLINADTGELHLEGTATQLAKPGS